MPTPSSIAARRRPVQPNLHRRRRLVFESLNPRMLLAADAAAAACETDPQCSVVFHEDFEPDDGGFTADNTGGTIKGFWHHSLGRRDDGLPGHSRSHAFYYGQFETVLGGGRYPVFTDHQGVLSSPDIDLSCGASELQFQYLLDTRTPTDQDFVEVRVLDVQAGTTEVILSRADGSLPETIGVWETATADLSAFAGRTIQLQFSFDTGDAEMIDPEGWYVDDILITTQAVCSADVSVTKSADDNAPNEGQTIAYTIMAFNSSASQGAATDVTVTDGLPEELIFQSATVTEGTYDPGSGIWTGLTLEPGEKQTLVLLVTIADDTSGDSITNTADIMAAQDDPNSGDNTAVETVVVNRVDLEVEKTVDDMSPVEGDEVTFTITVTNRADSNADATMVEVRDTLPVGLDFVNASDEGMFDPITRVVTWNIPLIALGDPFPLTLVANVAAGTTGQTLVNEAFAEGDETDPDDSNNRGVKSITVGDQASADLQVSKTVDDASPVVGDVVTFTINVANNAGSAAPATDVVVRDELPPGLLPVSLSDGGSFDASTREVTWSNVTIDVGTSRDFVIEALVQSSASGTILENVAVAEAGNPDPNPDDNRDAVVFSVGTSVQFIAPLSVYRPNGPQPGETVQDLTPAPGLATISGHKWHDVDQDGVWDTDEVGRSGWLFFLDLNENGSFESATEPTSLTDANGRYVFKDLDPGTYEILQAPTPSAGIFRVGKAIEPVTVVADQIVAGQSGVAEEPNVGDFDYSPFIRPADAFADRLAEPGVLSAITPWQVFNVRNTTDADLNITSVDTSEISDVERNFIRVLRVTDGGTPEEISFPVSIPVGADASFLVTYDPAIRNESRDMVIEQFPDWFSDSRLTNRAHRFEDNARIRLVTDQDASFSLDLAGNATYDSDITYDGVLANADIVRFSELALNDIYEPTSDPNTRCPNGAGDVLEQCIWAINGPPPREIGFGDIAVLHRESDDVSARPPFIDLDPLNQTGIPGTSFFTQADNGTAKIATAQARFANQELRVLQSLTITITNRQAGDTLQVDPMGLNPDFTFDVNPEGDTLTISGPDIRLEDYNEALQAVSFVGSASEGRLVTVTVQALGSQSPDGPFTRLLDDSELLSNVAVARIVIPEPDFSTAASRVGEGSQDALLLIDLCVPGAEHNDSESDLPLSEQETESAKVIGTSDSSGEKSLATVIDLRDQGGEKAVAEATPPTLLLSMEEDRHWSSAVDETMADWESYCMPLV